MFYLTRPMYQKLYLTTPGEPGEDLAEYVASQYPKSTAAAATELRTRGLDATPTTLHVLLRTGDMPKPESDLHGLTWTQADIDRAAKLLDRDGRRTLWGAMLEYFNLDADDAALSRAKALQWLPSATDSDLGVIIVPGLPGQGVPAVIKYLTRAAAVVASKIGA